MAGSLDTAEMKVVTLPKHFGPGFGFTEEELPEAEIIVEKYQEVYDAVVAGLVCVRFTGGEHEGSIARVAIDSDYTSVRPGICAHRCDLYSNRFRTRRIHSTDIIARATWDGRSETNTIFIPSQHVEILFDYDGPTVWKSA